ncbi:MAG: HlyD family efflux transporter periplasmic adaptor subunit [Flavobacteriaceae bacterium]|nr:HlyD family efflux transporter periplasmic adaptor subunit [Flavobacteriaceae bacterium]
MNNEGKYFQQRSEEVKEIMFKHPSSIVRLGISVILVIIILLLTGSNYISYNDILKTNIIITSTNPPVNIIAKEAGRFDNIFVQPDQFVKKNELLAVLENSADYRDVFKLKKIIDTVRNSINGFDNLPKELPINLKLGKIQSAYFRFRHQYQYFLNDYTLDFYDSETNFIKKRIQEKKVEISNLRERLLYHEEELKSQKEIYKKKKLLFDKGVISETILYLNQSSLSKFEKTKEYYKSLIQSQNDELLILKDNLRTSFVNKRKAISSVNQQLEESIQEVIDEIFKWESSYLLVSPTRGKVSFFEFFNAYQNVEKNDILFAIIPNISGDIIGKAFIPVESFGKVILGQKVIIKIDNYPYHKWGSIEGVVYNISKTPKPMGLNKKLSYIVDVEISSLNSSYGRKLNFKHEMSGVGEIILEELSVFDRIFYGQKEVLHK